jgi:Glycosyltransferases, probably involved in cell wall biogenesis
MVSVLLLSWNHEKYIEQAIRSIMRQAYRELEIVYLDNNSTDNTFAIANQVLAESGVPYVACRRENNFGISSNYKFLFQRSCGEYICLLSGDDWLHKDNILEKVKVLNSFPGVGMVQSGGYKYHQDIGVYEPLKVISYPDEKALDELLANNYISSTGILLRRSAVEEVGGWNESLIAEDGELWIRILTKYKIGSVDRYLYYYRQHAAGISSDPEFMYRAHMEIYESSKHLNKSKRTALRKIKDHYLSVKLKNNTSFKLFLQVLRNFRFEKIYFMLLAKSLLPVSWKQWYFIRSFRKKYQHIKIDE